MHRIAAALSLSSALVLGACEASEPKAAPNDTGNGAAGEEHGDLPAGSSEQEADQERAGEETEGPETNTDATEPMTDSNSFHSLSTNSLEGEPVDLGRYRGKALLVVNVASQCGLTPQYEGLQALHEEIGGENFAIVAFPSNDFGGQEPGSPAEIREFCSSNYEVSFDMMEKVSTKSGAIYDWLAEKTDGQRPTWNFSKYLVSKDGTSVRFFDPRTEPSDPELRQAIDALRSN